MPPVFGPVSLSTDSLVILRSAERQNGFTIAEDEEAGFLAAHEFFNDNLGPGIAENAAEHLVNRSASCRHILGYNNALSGGQPVCLHHNRRALGPDIFLRCPRLREPRPTPPSVHPPRRKSHA